MFLRSSHFIIVIVCCLFYFIFEKKNFFLQIDFDTSIEITKMYHNEIFNIYPHHQGIVFYYKVFFVLFSFVQNEYQRFIYIFMIHYFVALIILWKIIETFSKNFLLNLLYFISISISGIFLYLLFSLEDSIITLPYYFLSFYLFILFTKNQKYYNLILSGLLSGFSVSINSSDFFLSFGILAYYFFKTLLLFAKKNQNYKFYAKAFLYYFFSFAIVLGILLFIKAIVSKSSFFDVIKYTFISPHSMYKELLGDFGITKSRIIKTLNAFSFMLLQDPKLFTQLNYKIILIDIFIFLIFIFSFWELREEQSFYVVLIIISINFFILITSDELAINERLVNGFFIFILLLKSKRKFYAILFSLIFIHSLFNLKNFFSSKEPYDKLFLLAKKEKILINIYYFYNPKLVDLYIHKKIDNDFLLRSSYGPNVGLANLILRNQCYIYSPYKVEFPYIPKHCKLIHDLNQIQENQFDFFDPYLKEKKANFRWDCKKLQNFLLECNQILNSYIPSKKPFFSDHMIENACQYFEPDCCQKIQYFCNFLYYCKPSFKYHIQTF